MTGSDRRRAGTTLRTMSAALVVLAALAVWGESGAAQPLELWIRGNSAHLEHLAPIIDEFNASQDRIRVNIRPGGEGIEAMTAAYLAGELPDILESAVAFNHYYSAQGWMASLEPFIAREGEDFLRDFFPATLDSDNRVNGVLYSLPIFLQIEGMYYNPEILANYGMAEPQPGWTWDDLRAMARQARRFASDGTIETWGLVARHPFQFDAVLVGQVGGYFITPDYEVAVDSEPVRRTYTWIMDMVGEESLHYIAGIHTNGPNDEGRAHRSAFVSDATYRQHTWTQLESPLRTAPPLRADLASEPKTRFSDRSLAIMNVAPERQEAAWEFIKFVLQPEQLARLNASLGYPPATISAAQHPIFLEYARANPNILIWSEMYSTIAPVQTWPAALQAEVMDPLVEASRALVRQEISLAQFISDLETRLSAIVREHLAHRR